VLVMLSHERRRIVHMNITEHPSVAGTAQQVVEAFPDDTAPRWLLRDRDCIYGEPFRRRVAGMEIREAICSPASPCQNPFVERVIGSIRRECLDHVIDVASLIRLADHPKHCRVLVARAVPGAGRQHCSGGVST
jgi:putative transposase